MATVATDYLDKATVIPHFATFENSIDTLGTLKISKTGEADMYCNASGAKKQKELFKMEKQDYDMMKEKYEKDVKAYNAAVAKVETELEDEERVIGEKRGPRGNRETSLTELPLKPVAPVKPEAFSGIDVLSKDVAYYAGFGMATSGVLSSNTLKYGDMK